MHLRNVCIVGGEEGHTDIAIDNGVISACTHTGTLQTDQPSVVFTNAVAFPGLINSHDHLDFNLFPKLGSGTYHSYREWGNDIQQNRQKEIDAVLRIPKPLRVQWGIYKNLLAGITTVVNHGAFLSVTDPLIDIHQQYHCIHSVGFDTNWKWKLNRPRLGDLPFVMHAGEGVDNASYQEISSCIRWNLFRKKIVAIHGVAMQPAQAAHFKALVWCADSNFFLFNTTAAIEELKFHVPVVIGTDSTLTAAWDVWKQLSIASGTGKLNSRELFDAVTSTPASVWGMKNKGKLEPGYCADIVVAESRADNNLKSFGSIEPPDILLVMKAGKILLFDESIKLQLVNAGINTERFSRFKISGREKHCSGNLSAVIREIRSYYPAADLPVEI